MARTLKFEDLPRVSCGAASSCLKVTYVVDPLRLDAIRIKDSVDEKAAAFEGRQCCRKNADVCNVLSAPRGVNGVRTIFSISGY